MEKEKNFDEIYREFKEDFHPQKIFLMDGATLTAVHATVVKLKNLMQEMQYNSEVVYWHNILGVINECLRRKNIFIKDVVIGKQNPFEAIAAVLISAEKQDHYEEVVQKVFRNLPTCFFLELFSVPVSTQCPNFDLAKKIEKYAYEIYKKKSGDCCLN